MRSRRRFSRRRFRRHHFQWVPTQDSPAGKNPTSGLTVTVNGVTTVDPATLVSFFILTGFWAGFPAASSLLAPGEVATFTGNAVQVKTLDLWSVLSVPRTTDQASIALAISTCLAQVTLQGSSAAVPGLPDVNQWDPSDAVCRSRRGWLTRIYDYFILPSGNNVQTNAAATMVGAADGVLGTSSPHDVRILAGFWNGACTGGFPYHRRFRLFGRRVNTIESNIAVIHAANQVNANTSSLLNINHWCRVLLRQRSV